MFLEHSNFPAFSLPESCSQTDQFPKNSLQCRISIIHECAQIASCFPNRRPIFAVWPSKVCFSDCQSQKRMYKKSLETRKSFEILEQKCYVNVILTRVFLLKQLNDYEITKSSQHQVSKNDILSFDSLYAHNQ